MNLSKLLSSLDYVRVYGSCELNISSVTNDSRKVKKDSLFVAIRGQAFDGNDFISEAISKGARVVVTESVKNKGLLGKATFIEVKNARKAFGVLLSKWYGNPSEKMKIIGVTGTDGKTTTVNLIYHILKEAGKKVGMISTINAKIGNKEIDTGFHVTCPDPTLLQKLLSDMVKAGCAYAVLEVTSHGLDQERVAGINFNLGILTNITHEHLDYHKTYQKYLLAKAKLLERSEVAILNKEDSSYKELLKLLKGKVKIVSYGRQDIPPQLLDVVKARFTESYNRLNAAAAITAAKLLGIETKRVGFAIESFPKLVGRMEEIKNDKNIKIIIDFAHTPNALKNVLTELKARTEGKLIVVFGSAGERDRQKRVLMGEIAANLADVIIVTAEDPRTEDVNKIIAEIEKGVATVGGVRCYKIPERGEAIFTAINKLAQEKDLVVICGKGHERSMCYGNIEYPWSDQEAVKLALQGKVKKIVKE
jgi:UDP-N-acetylmuramoyl-L-alanyl-D-glutamate--2,6-diaminopimelate ligase